MELLDMFKKKYDLPQIYDNLITKDEYNYILEVSIDYFNKNDIKITNINEGEIVIEYGEEIKHCFLDNLIRFLTSYDKKEWTNLIKEHFDKIFFVSNNTDEIFENFNYGKQFLRVLLKNSFFDPGDDRDNLIYRSDLPQLSTFLIVETDGLFKYVKKDEIAKWNKEESELFAIAINNTPIDEIEVNKHNIEDKFPLFVFLSGDFSASLMLDLKNRADYTIGTYGSLVCIPTKGTTFVHPIENADFMELISFLYPKAIEFYSEDPGAVSLNFYWYYEGKFYLFPTKQNEDGYFISFPSELEELLGVEQSE